MAGGREKSFSSQGACSMLRMDTLGIEPRAFRMRIGCDTTTPCAPEPLLSWCHPHENMASSFWLTRSARKSGTHVLSNGHTSPTLRKWTRDDLEHFFEQKHLSKIGVEKPPKSSHPAFCKVLPSRAPCRTAVWTSKIQGRQTAQLKRCLWRWEKGSMQHAVHGHTEPRAFRMRSGCDTTTPCAPEPLLSWSSFLADSPSQSGTHVLSSGKMDVGWRGMI